MKIRWFIYFIIGMIFGVFDFFLHRFISTVLGQGGSLWRVLTYGVWLVPLIPISLFEARISKSIIKTAFVCSFTWLLSIISYYLYMGVQLAFLGLSTRPELHISRNGDPFFLDNWKSVFWYDIFGGIVEWSVIAIMGGFFMGIVMGTIYLHLENLRKSKG